jgi:hypothetical protein
MDDRAEENFHRISIRLSTDYRKLSYVQIVNDRFKEEQDSLLQQVRALDGDTDSH